VLLPLDQNGKNLKASSPQIIRSQLRTHISFLSFLD
jgi:hypothetical protein